MYLIKGPNLGPVMARQLKKEDLVKYFHNYTGREFNLILRAEQSEPVIYMIKNYLNTSIFCESLE